MNSDIIFGYSLLGFVFITIIMAFWYGQIILSIRNHFSKIFYILVFCGIVAYFRHDYQLIETKDKIYKLNKRTGKVVVESHVSKY